MEKPKQHSVAAGLPEPGNCLLFELQLPHSSFSNITATSVPFHLPPSAWNHSALYSAEAGSCTWKAHGVAVVPGLLRIPLSSRRQRRCGIDAMPHMLGTAARAWRTPRYGSNHRVFRPRVACQDMERQVRRARLLVLAVPWQLTQTYSGTCNGRPTRLLKLEGIEVRDDADLWLTLRWEERHLAAF
jgi:hypothetical protein